MRNNNTTEVLTRFIAALKIPVTRLSIRNGLNTHPDNNSLLAFSDLLNGWNVPNAAYQLSFNQLKEVPLPFIAFISKREFAVVTSFDENQATLYNQNYNNKQVPIDTFENLYSGSVLVAEKGENSGEADYAKKRIRDITERWRMPVFFAGALALLLGLLLVHSDYINAFTLQTGLLTLFKTAGLTAAVLLLIQSIDTNNPLVQKLCGGDDNRDCNAILSSKAAKITNGLSWSEVGFFYFAGTWLVLLFNSGSTPIIQVLALLNIISLPYTFYSIYYQWRIAKQWCIFCCAVQAILWLEFFALAPYLFSGIQIPNLPELTNLIGGLATPVLVWMFIKPFLLKAQQIDPLTKQLNKFKYNTELFEKMLNDEVKYTLPPEEHSLIIGNREAEHIITMVSNPYCQPCAKTHKALDEWLETRKDIKLQIVFATANDERDKRTEIAGHLMAMQNGQNDISLKKALNDWYAQKHKNYSAWVKDYPIEKSVDIPKLLETQKQWCSMAEIKSTPTLLLNGRKLPKTYQPEDLKYFI